MHGSNQEGTVVIPTQRCFALNEGSTNLHNLRNLDNNGNDNDL
jgi:hypothetical protein